MKCSPIRKNAPHTINTVTPASIRIWRAWAVRARKALAASRKRSAISLAISLAARKAAGAPGAQRGADLRTTLDITLEQAAHGDEAKLRVPGWSNCVNCHGSGAAPG